MLALVLDTLIRSPLKLANETLVIEPLKFDCLHQPLPYLYIKTIPMDIVQWLVDQINKPIKTFLYTFNIDKWSCRHCEGAGVCTSGYNDHLGDKYSCHSCIKSFDPTWDGISDKKTVKCSICAGTGRVGTKG
jgi:hypothetical protein